MDFPADPPVQTPIPEGLAAALGAEPREAWASSYLIAVLVDEAAVRALAPDIAALKDLANQATRGSGNVAVTALADPGRPYAVVSRFFAPGSGIPEDPATGSLHCALAPLFARKLATATVRFHQAYPGRGADIECETAGDRVLIRGRATTVVESRLRF